MADFTFICCVVDVGQASRAFKCAKKYGVKGGTFYMGRGVVHSRLLEFLQINEVRREIVTMIIEDELAAGAIKGLIDEMEFHKPNHGILFSYSVNEFLGSKNELVKKSESNEVKSTMYKIIYTIVDKGRAEDVIEAATKAGAPGGTIINARGAGPHEVQTLFSVEVEPEKEIAYVIAKSEMKDAIVDSIRTHLKIDEPGNGILYVLDINEVYGLYTD